MASPRKARLLALLLPALPHLLPLLLGRVYFYGDLLLYFIPWRALARAEALSGRVALWNPFSFCGQPFLASLQSALLYPPNIATLLLPPAVAIHVLIVLHASWAGLGMFLLGRAFGLTELPALVASLAFSMGGFFVTKSQLLSMYMSISWAPWILLAAWGCGRSWRPVLGLGAALAMCLLAGHGQIALMMGLLALSLAALRGRGAFWRAVLGCGLSLLLGAGQLLPTGELLLHSPRAAMSFEEGMRFSLPPWQVLSFLSFGAFGHPALSGYFGFGNYWETCGYAGVLTLALLGGAPLGRKGRFLVGVAAVGLLLSFGRFFPLPHRLLWLLPPFRLFHDPARFLLLYALGISLLSGMGTEALLRGEGRASRGAGLVTGAMAATSLLLLAVCALLPAVAPRLAEGLTQRLLEAARLEYRPEMLPAYARHLVFLPVARSFGLTLIWAASSLVVLSLLGRGRKAAVVVVLWLDLALHALMAYPTVKAKLLSRALERAPRLPSGPLAPRYIVDEEGLRELLKRRMGYVHYPLDPGRAIGEVVSALAPNTNVLLLVPCAGGYDPLRPGRPLQVVRLAERRLERGDGRLALALGVARRVVFVEGRARVEGLSGSASPFYTVGRSLVAASFPEFERVVSSRAFDPRGEAVVGRPPTPAPEGRADLVRARWLGDGAEFYVETRHPTLLVTGIAAYPGWRAFVGGAGAGLLVANWCILAVPVGAGGHTVRLVFHPGSFSVGLYISLLAWFGLVGSLIATLWPFRSWTLRRSRRPS